MDASDTLLLMDQLVFERLGLMPAPVPAVGSALEAHAGGLETGMGFVELLIRLGCLR